MSDQPSKIQTMNAAALIGLDWGISSFRATLFDGAGAVIDTVAGPAGIANVPDGAFEMVLMLNLSEWFAANPDVPVLAAGMITSRQGWCETPYLALPAGPDELAAALTTRTLRDGRAIAFVPGFSQRDPADVMRGEETQIAGAGLDDGLCILPGSHSKWAQIQDGKVVGFATFLTGELYGLLKIESMVGRALIDDDDDEAGFLAGAEAAPRAAGPLNALFGLRAGALLETLDGPATSAMLSGLLIGLEVQEAKALLGLDAGRQGALALVGRADLTRRYQRVLEGQKMAVSATIEDAAAQGLWAIAKLAGLADR